MAELESALEALDPDALKGVMDHFIDTGVPMLQKVLRVTAIFGRLKDELEEVCASAQIYMRGLRVG